MCNENQHQVIPLPEPAQTVDFIGFPGIRMCVFRVCTEAGFGTPLSNIADFYAEGADGQTLLCK